MRDVISLKNALTGNRSSAANARSPDYRIIGDNHRDARQWAAAAEAYGQHLEAHPEHAAIWIQAGNCFKEAGNFAKSLAAYRKAEQLDPSNFDIHVQLGHLHKITGNLAAALAAYERAATLEPELGELRHEISEVAERMKSAEPRSPAALSLYGSVEELLDALRKMPGEDDPFVGYFRSIGGYAADSAQ